ICRRFHMAHNMPLRSRELPSPEFSASANPMSTVEARRAVSGSAVSFQVVDGVGIVTIDQPDKAVNLLSAEVVDELAQVIARLESGSEDARAAVIISGKPGVWIAGADVEQLAEVRSAADGEAL